MSSAQLKKLVALEDFTMKSSCYVSSGSDSKDSVLIVLLDLS